jgi:hypothetical protein
VVSRRHFVGPFHIPGMVRIRVRAANRVPEPSTWKEIRRTSEDSSLVDRVPSSGGNSKIGFVVVGELTVPFALLVGSHPLGTEKLVFGGCRGLGIYRIPSCRTGIVSG